MTLQSVIASRIESLGSLSFQKFRGFRTIARSSDAPFRFVDGELIEEFLKCDPDLQDEIVQQVGYSSVGEVKRMIEALQKLH